MSLPTELRAAFNDYMTKLMHMAGDSGGIAANVDWLTLVESAPPPEPLTLSQVLTLASGLALSGTGTNLITSATSAASASSTVGAFTLAPTATLDANDLILDIKSKASGGTTVFKVDKEGDTTVASIAASNTSGASVSVDSSTRIDFNNGAFNGGVISSGGSLGVLNLGVLGNYYAGLTSTDWRPLTNNQISLGTDALRWSSVNSVLGSFSNTVEITGANAFSTALKIPQGKVLCLSDEGAGFNSGFYTDSAVRVYVRTNGSGRFEFNTSEFKPSNDNLYELGTTGLRWANIYSSSKGLFTRWYWCRKFSGSNGSGQCY